MKINRPVKLKNANGRRGGKFKKMNRKKLDHLLKLGFMEEKQTE